jgi:hypothetical protein
LVWADAVFFHASRRYSAAHPRKKAMVIATRRARARPAINRIAVILSTAQALRADPSP